MEKLPLLDSLSSQSAVEVTEQAVTRKVDLRIIPFVSFLYLLSFLDRINIGNVHSTMDLDLLLSESQFGLVVGVFFVGYVLFELPSNMLLKRFTPSRWISRIMVTWGILAVSMAFARTFYSLLAIRFLLGVAEAGFFPGIVFYLTRWYPNRRLALRISLFYCSSALAGAFGGLLAYFILMKFQGQLLGLKNYQWLFILEGLPSIIFGIVTWFYLPDFPDTAAWLSASEKQVVIASLGPQSSTNDDVNSSFLARFFHWGSLKRTLSLPILWYIAVMDLLILTPFYSSAFFLPSFISSMVSDPITANLLTVPIYLVAAGFTIVIAWNSDRFQERKMHLTILCTFSCIGFLGMALCGHKSAQSNATVLGYLSGGLAVISGYPTLSTVLAWLTSELNRLAATLDSATSMAASTAVVVSFGNIGGFLGPQIYSASFKYTESYALAHMVMCFAMLVAALMAALSQTKAFENRMYLY